MGFLIGMKRTPSGGDDIRGPRPNNLGAFEASYGGELRDRDFWPRQDDLEPDDGGNLTTDFGHTRRLGDVWACALAFGPLGDTQIAAIVSLEILAILFYIVPQGGGNCPWAQR